MELAVKVEFIGETKTFGNDGGQKKEFAGTYGEGKKIAFVSYGQTCAALDSIAFGQQVKVTFDIASREYNGRWYTDLKAWKIEVLQSERVAPPSNVPSTPPVSPPAGSDDLPF